MGASVVRTVVEPPAARRFVRPLPVVAGLPEPCCAAQSQAHRRARRVRSIWMPPEGDRLGEKLMLMVLAAAGITGIVQGLLFLVNYIENSAVVHQAVARLLQ